MQSQPTVDVAFSWYEDEVTTTISDSLYGLSIGYVYVHCVAKQTHTFETCRTLGEKTVPSISSDIYFQIDTCHSIENKWFIFPRKDLTMI